MRPILSRATVNVLKFEHFSLPVLKKSVVYRSWNSQMLVGVANREDPDLTASAEVV